MTPRVFIKRFEIPALADTDAALAFGKKLTYNERRQLIACSKAMSAASLAARDLQDRVDFATTAQLWREAAESSGG